MQDTLVQQGMDLMFTGMGTVFVFLTLLVIGTLAMSTIVTRFFHVEEVELPEPVAKEKAAPVNKKTLAVIQAAVHAHRAKK